jgi:hypothetical protein
LSVLLKKGVEVLAVADEVPGGQAIQKEEAGEGAKKPGALGWQGGGVGGAAATPCSAKYLPTGQIRQEEAVG